jgi:hypothetical protein
MAAATTSETWDAAWTLTSRVNRGRLTDNIFDATPLLDRMRRKGALEMENGGKEIQENLLYGGNAIQWFSGYDQLNTDAVGGITASFYKWRYVSTPVTISFTDEQENRKRDQALSLLKAKTQQSTKTIMTNVNAALWSSQSGKSILGMQDVIADTPTNTLGGINRSTETWFKNQVDGSGGDFDNKTGDIYDGLGSMSAMYNLCAEGNTEPTHIWTTLTHFGELETILESTGYARLTGGSTEAGVDASKPKFRKAVVNYDRDVPANRMYFHNYEFLKFKVQKGMNFAKTPFKSPSNQLAQVAFMILGGQLVTNNPRRLGVITFT